MNTEQERADFEAWYQLHHGSRDMYERDASGEYADKQVQSAFNVWQARAALQSQDREDAQEIAATLATVLHFIPRNDEPELYADVERLCGKFGDHARRVEGDGE